MNFQQHDFSTLKWFLFEEYKKNPKSERELASHPNNSATRRWLLKNKINSEYKIPHADGELFLTDILDFTEVVDEDLGAGGIVGYLRNLIEHFILIDTIRGLYRVKKDTLKEVLFVKDGPLGFFGQTANMHEPMRELLNHLNSELNIF